MLLSKIAIKYCLFNRILYKWYSILSFEATPIMSGPVGAAGFIVFRRAQASIEYLLMETSYGQHHWTPPKGHVDPGEDEWKAAVRETREEAGLDHEKDLSIVRDFKVVTEYRCTTKKLGTHDKRVTYWLAELSREGAEVVLSDEHQDYKWLPLDEACKLARFEAMQDALKKSEQKLIGGN